VGSAGTVTVQISAGQLILIDVTAAPGWGTEVDRADGERIEVEFESGGNEAEFEARVHNGELRVRIEPS
jgi:methyl coenzyme M reductase subunit D